MDQPPPQKNAAAERLSWALQKIISSQPFQRLRFIRQNGLTNLAFHGAEHTRFTHSLGVQHLARTMYERICRNTSEQEDCDVKLETCIAALVHDVGHGPFSHAMEEILRSNNVAFDHEQMTLRFIREDSSPINRILNDIDPQLPESLRSFFDKKLRKADHWKYKIVSSQLDADRLDYSQRDALFAGIRGHGFDAERILDLIYHNEANIAVERGAIEAIEAYLVTLDQLYRAIYYHHTVRAATQMLISLFERAWVLHKEGDKAVLPLQAGGRPHPMAELFEHGDKIDLATYSQLSEFHCWTLIESWQRHADKVLAELARRILERRLFKAIEVDPQNFTKTQTLLNKAKELTLELYPEAEGWHSSQEHFVRYDDPTRTSYKVYDWRPESTADSIWLVAEDGSATPLENDEKSPIVQAFKGKRYFDRIIVPPEVRRKLLDCS
ncbi:MAG: HD domain-containing protein [Pseudorhodoplanes sp.]|nr:HD domain-containing protein [Pseudorhodoplanes sp.]